MNARFAGRISALPTPPTGQLDCLGTSTVHEWGFCKCGQTDEECDAAPHVQKQKHAQRRQEQEQRQQEQRRLQEEEERLRRRLEDPPPLFCCSA